MTTARLLKDKKTKHEVFVPEKKLEVDEIKLELPKQAQKPKKLKHYLVIDNEVVRKMKP